jgi:hypothetical protein
VYPDNSRRRGRSVLVELPIRHFILGLNCGDPSAELLLLKSLLEFADLYALLEDAQQSTY